MWTTCRQLHFLFYDKSPTVLQTNIKNMANQMYVNEFLLYRSSCANPFSVTRLEGPVQTTYVVRLSCATLYGTTRPGVPVQMDYVA
jgi:hypothetical protein